MGKILERFETQAHRNEDEVKQNFILPLFQNFLGYELIELVPERRYPARDIHSGVHKVGDTKGLTNKPDYVACLDGDVDVPKFVIDAKGPNEILENHLAQVKSYTLSVGVNLIVLTNGQGFEVLDSNEPLFRARNLHELEVRFEELYRILSRESQSTKTLKQIVASIDHSISLGQSAADADEVEKLSRQAFVQGFKAYLEQVTSDYSNWQLPQGFGLLKEMHVKPVDPVTLYTLQLDGDAGSDASGRGYSCNEVLVDFDANVRVISGEAGIGKTTLLRYIMYSEANRTLRLEQARIPVYIKLRQVSNSTTLAMIVDRELRSRGYSYDSLYSELSRYDFLFLLDGFDEVPKTLARSVLDEIVTYSRLSLCIITTRPKEIIALPATVRFTIAPLDSAGIGRIVREYIPKQHEKFFREISSRDLTAEMSNTLLLTLMLLLFVKDRTLPSSSARITQRVVSHIYNWTTQRVVVEGLPSVCLDELMGKVAFHSTQTGDVDFQRSDVETLLTPLLKNYQNERRVDVTLTIERTVEELLATGLIVESDGGVSFWHSMFRDHFTSLALAGRLKKDLSFINSIRNKRSWTKSIEGSALLFDDASNMILELKDDVWLASSCLLNAQTANDQCFDAIVDDLLERCCSSIMEIRDRATYFLSRLNEAGRLHDRFIEIFKSSSDVDIRMAALEQISRSSDEQAQQIVLEHLDWSDGGGLFRYGASVSVVRALANLGGAHLIRIAEVWKSNATLPDVYAFEEVCLRLLRQGLMTKELLAELGKMYLEALDDPKRELDVASLGRVMIEAADETIVDALIESLEKPAPRYTLKTRHSQDILASYQTLSVVEKLRVIVVDEKRAKEARELCANSLLKSKAEVPLEIFEEFEQSDLDEIQVVAVKALSRFPKAMVSSKINEYLDSPSVQIQNAAISWTVDNCELPNRLQQKLFPEKLFWPSVYTIVEAIAKHSIAEGVEILDHLGEHVLSKGQEQNLVESLVAANASIGRLEVAEQLIRDKYYDTNQLMKHKDYEITKLMKAAVLCRPEFASKVLLDVFAYLLTRVPKDGQYLEERFIEHVEELGTLPLRNALKKLVDVEIERGKQDSEYYMHFERVFRAFTKVGTDEDREWTLRVLEMNPHWHHIDRKRVIECLGRYGTQDDIGVIRRFAKEFPTNELVLRTCLHAYESILWHAGIRREVSEAELLS